MKTCELFRNIKQWGIDRNLHTADPLKQLIKLDEEVDELKQAIALNNRELTIDSIGDITVVLVQLASQLQLDYIGCVNAAYQEIKDRKGKLVNGMFVKEV